MPYVINTSLLTFRLQSEIHANNPERCDAEINKYAFLDGWQEDIHTDN